MIELLWNVPCAVAAVTAWLLVYRRRAVPERWPFWRPIALLLTANTFADLAGFALRQGYLAELPRPYTGLARVAFHLEQALFLAYHWGVAAVAVVVLARRLPWPVLAWIAAVAVAVIGYSIDDAQGLPWLRGKERVGVFLYVNQFAVVAICAWSYARYHRSMRDVDYPLAHQTVAMMLATMEGALLFGPYMFGIRELDPFRFWWLAQIGYVGLFSWLALTQWRLRWTPTIRMPF